MIHRTIRRDYWRQWWPVARMIGYQPTPRTSSETKSQRRTRARVNASRGKSLITEVCLRRLLQWPSARFFHLEPTLFRLARVQPSHAKQRMAPASVSSVLIGRAFVSSEGTEEPGKYERPGDPLDFVSRA